MYSLIGLLIFIAGQLIFDYGAAENSTHWAVFYFTTNYVAWVVVAAGIILKENSDAIKYTVASIVVYIIFLIVLEFVYIDLPLDVYMERVNNLPVTATAGICLCIAFIYLTFKTWEKVHGKKSQRR